MIWSVMCCLCLGLKEMFDDQDVTIDGLKTLKRKTLLHWVNAIFSFFFVLFWCGLHITTIMIKASLVCCWPICGQAQNKTLLRCHCHPILPTPRFSSIVVVVVSIFVG